jgi:hypothetical protein
MEQDPSLTFLQDRVYLLRNKRIIWIRLERVPARPEER